MLVKTLDFYCQIKRQTIFHLQNLNLNLKQSILAHNFLETQNQSYERNIRKTYKY